MQNTPDSNFFRIETSLQSHFRIACAKIEFWKYIFMIFKKVVLRKHISIILYLF